MIRKPTTLILGAGASLAYGYPSGAGLIGQIIALLDRQLIIEHAATKSRTISRLSVANDEQYKIDVPCFYKNIAKFCQSVKNARPTNIDSFLRDNPSCESLGRAIIAYLIRLSEHNSNGDIIPNASNNPWYPLLLEAIISRSDAATLAENINLKIITFNYDISLEFYLASQLLANERTRPYAEKIFANIPILHMYGKVAEVSIKEEQISSDYGSLKTLIINQDFPISQTVWNSVEKCPLHVAIEKKGKDTDVIRNSKTALSYLENSAQVLAMGFDFALDNCDLMSLPQDYWSKTAMTYLNFDKSPNLRDRVRQMMKYSGNPIEITGNCFSALSRDYDLTN